jgi:AcrR family transcriptional regulator
MRSPKPPATKIRGDKKTPAAAPVASGAAKLPQQKRRRSYLPADERRRLIIAAAQEVFARTSLQGARTRDLAKAAEVNQATLFEHFESKEVLFQEAVVKPMLDAMRGMRGRAAAYEGADSVEALRDLARDSARRHVEVMAKIFPLFTAALFSDLASGRKLYREQIAPLLKQRSEVISGLIREDLDPEFVELATFGILFAIAMDRTFKNKVWNIDDVVDQLMIMTTTGFARQSAAGGARRKPGRGRRAQ